LAAILLIVGVTSLFLLFSRVSAAEKILKASEEASRQFDVVTHQVFRMTTIRPNDTRSREIERWRDERNGLVITRSYKDNGEVQWETHTGPEGKKIYQLPDAKTLNAPNEDEIPIEILRAIGNLWERDLEAKTFREIVGNVDHMTVAETPDLYLIQSDQPTESLVSASITIRKNNLRPIQQSYVFTFARQTYSLTITEMKMDQIKRDAIDLKNFPPAQGLVEQPSK